MRLNLKPSFEMTEEILRDGYNLRDQILSSMVRQAEDAFAAGADYVSLTNGRQEVGRIYRDGRQWMPPRR